MSKTDGICRFCGHKKDGQPFEKWVKPTFTDFDKVRPGNVVCNDCLFWFDEKSQELADKMGKEKPQRIRNYSHFILAGEWIPLSKGNKAEMVKLLLGKEFPELVVIAESGQKHISFRARRNPPGGKAGWVQFEENAVWVDPRDLQSRLKTIERLYSSFSKYEIASGNYKPHRIMKFGIEQWNALEIEIKPWRGSLLFNLVLFLAQKEDDNAENSSRFAGNRLAGDRQQLQKPLPPDDLGAIREHGERGGVHKQSREIHQLSMFET